mmetsp:Transcript_37791/g.91075  ORF Transcript_37791/g.91075 Transcript_37791/m.91075 type:complete len:106 (-) Transcript_37791:15-332(-)
MFHDSPREAVMVCWTVVSIPSPNILGTFVGALGTISRTYSKFTPSPEPQRDNHRQSHDHKRQRSMPKSSKKLALIKTIMPMAKKPNPPQWTESYRTFDHWQSVLH